MMDKTGRSFRTIIQNLANRGLKDPATSRFNIGTQLFFNISKHKNSALQNHLNLILQVAKPNKSGWSKPQETSLDSQELSFIQHDSVNGMLEEFFAEFIPFYQFESPREQRGLVQYKLNQEQILKWLPKLIEFERVTYDEEGTLNWFDEPILGSIEYKRHSNYWNLNPHFSKPVAPTFLGPICAMKVHDSIILSPFKSDNLFKTLFLETQNLNPVFIKHAEMEEFIHEFTSRELISDEQIKQIFGFELVRAESDVILEISQTSPVTFHVSGRLEGTQSQDKKANSSGSETETLAIKTAPVAAQKLAHYCQSHLGFKLDFEKSNKSELYDPARLIKFAFDLGVKIEFNGKAIRRQRNLGFEISATQSDWFDVSTGENLSLEDLEQAASTQENYFLSKKGVFFEISSQNKQNLKTLLNLLDRRSHRQLKITGDNKWMLLHFLNSGEQYLTKELSEKLITELEALNNLKEKPQLLAQPKGITGTPRDYQTEGYSFICNAWKVNLNPCLADDMGLGKTFQTISAIMASKGKLPAVVICPKTLVWNWREEFKKFSPSSKVKIYNQDAKRLTDDFKDLDVLIVSAPLFRLDLEFFKKCQWSIAVVDEAQMIKNPTAQITVAAYEVRAEHRLALTGTPIENSISDLISIFHFLNPQLIPYSLATRLRANKVAVEDDVELIRKILNPLIMRRTKGDVLKELPAKTESDILVDLEKTEKETYVNFKNSLLATLTEQFAKIGFNNSKMHVLEGLLRLRQLSCHSRLVYKDKDINSSAKLKAAIELIQDVTPNKVVVFSQFTSLLDILGILLAKEGITFTRLDGKTKNRQEVVAEFQSENGPQVFLVSLKAGGVGLNLTEASYGIILDPWWNVAAEQQAQDRLHRIGQKRAVFIYRLIAKDTVEQKILELQKNKKELSDTVLSGDNLSLGKLKSDDIIALLK